MEKRILQLIPGAYVFVIAALFLYSYTQVDLSLTIANSSIFQRIQAALQYIGFYQRPLSTLIYCGLLSLLFVFYILILRYAKQGILHTKDIWKLVALTTGILLFSYPAFSYDIFNYMFTAKTVLLYHKNPYEVIPLDFSGVEPWLSFMRWTHLPSAYTPIWILLTLPFYLLGFSYFLFIMWSMKLLVVLGHICTVFFIQKILQDEDKKNAALGMAIFALNPLIIIENLVSAHNDVVMMGFVMGAVWLLRKKRVFHAWTVWSVSVATKFMTLFLFPLFVIGYTHVRALALLLVGLGLVMLQREILPWYWVWIVPFIALLPRNTMITNISTGVSLGLLLRYAPFLYFGNWDGYVSTIKTWVTFIPVLCSFCILFVRIWANRTK